MKYHINAVLVVAVMLAIIASPGQAEWSTSPLDPAYIRFQSQQASGEAQMQGGEGYQPQAGFGLIPCPIDFSHLERPRRLLGAGPLPSSYDLRTTGKLTAVRDQSACGSCWAFASYGSLESCLLPGETLDFSENHLKNNHGFDSSCCDGGLSLWSVAYLARWEGAITEAQDGYNISSCTSPSGLTPVKHIQEALLIPDRAGPLDNDQLKEAVMSHGAIYTSFYYYDGYYRENTHSYYCPDSYSWGNHAVCIVGWNDSYPAGNFNSTPPGNGAFIVRNSWGTGWGESGYFYVSYYDTTFGRENVAFVNGESTTNYKENYQYDPLGLVSFLGDESETAWCANVFTASTSDKLGAVGFYAAQANTAYEIRIYLDPTSGPINPSGPVETKTGSLSYAGYHTVVMNSPVTLTQGHTFSVVVKLTTPDYDYPIPCEFPSWYYYTSQATANAGESYISMDGTNWDDLTSVITGANACIKGFTLACDGLVVSPSDPAEFVGPVGGSFSPSSVNYTLTNNDSESIDWTAAKTQSWLVLSATSGTLQPSGSTQVTLTLGSEAYALSYGGYSDAITFANVTTGCGTTDRAVSLIVSNGQLSVEPSGGLVSTGNQGGPFTPSEIEYTIKNTGYTDLDWTASKSESWVSLSSATGHLDPQQSTTVTVSINSGADSLPTGYYSDSVSFDWVNAQNETGDIARSVNLRVGPVYVKPNGDDNNDGSSWATAKRTVGAAVDAASPNLEVWVAAGTYKENITIRSAAKLYGGFNGTETNLNQRNWKLNKSILDGNGLDSVVEITSDATGAVVDGFAIRNGRAFYSWMAAGGVFCHTAATIANNTIVGNNGDGIYCAALTGVPTITNNLVMGNGVRGIAFYASAVVTNNTVVGNFGGISMFGWAQNFTPVIANNICAFNNWGFQNDSVVNWTIKNNCIYQNLSGNYQGLYGEFPDQTGINGNISVDPKLFCREHRDLHIAPDSPCRDAGDDTCVNSALDMDLQSRTQGSHVDIGADESYGESAGYYVRVVRVKSDGNDLNDGSTWALAKASVQAAIDAVSAEGGEVWVKAGTYNERITLPAFVYVYGGFSGTEVARSQRDWTANVTTLNGGHAGSVVTISGGYQNSTLDGFTITNGYSEDGAGIYCSHASSIIANDTISDNSAWRFGGGVFSAWFVSNIFSNDIVENNTCEGETACGGGFFLQEAVCYDRIENSVIRNNIVTASTQQYGCGGGGIYCPPCSYYCCGPVITGNLITGNQAVGTGVWLIGGGALLYDQAILSNNVIAGNTAGHYGGGAFMSEVWQPITNNTVVDNTASVHGGGLYMDGWAGSDLSNNIIAFNSSGIVTPGVVLNNNDVYGNTAYNYYEQDPGPNDISADPAFVDQENGNYRLLSSSPCIDAGYDQNVPLTDIDGEARPEDGNGLAGAQWDIGAYEFGAHIARARSDDADGSPFSGGPLTVTATFPTEGWVYVERPDRAAGIRVNTTETFAEGDQVQVLGTVQTDAATGERYISATPPYPEPAGAPSSAVAPVGMRNEWLGGAAAGLAAGITTPDSPCGAHNVGLLVESWGRVMSVGADYLYINDGFDYDPETLLLSDGLKVQCHGFTPTCEVGDYVQVVGANSIDSGARLIRVNDPSDITVLTPSLVSCQLYAPDNLIGFAEMPFIPDPEFVLGSIENWSPDGALYRFESCNQGSYAYDIWDPGSFGKMEFGSGYWALNLPENDTLEYFGVDVSAHDQWLSIPKAGWALLGNPLRYDKRWSEFLVTNGRETVTLTEARDKGWLYSEGQWYDGETQTVQTFGLPDDEPDTEWWKPNHGYWVHSKVGGLALIVPAPPLVSMDEPETDGVVLRGTNQVEVYANDDQGISAVELWVDDEYHSTSSDPGPTYTFSLDTSLFSDGWHTLKAVAYEDNEAAAEGYDTRRVITINENDADSVGDLVDLPDGSWVSLQTGNVSRRFPSADCFYLQDNQTAGIKITSPDENPTEGDGVTVIGVLHTGGGGERYIDAENVSIISCEGFVPHPLGMRNGWLGGKSLGSASGVTNPAQPCDLYNIGILSETWGKITSVGADYFYVSDGSDSTGVKVKCFEFTPPYAVDTYVRVIGISSLDAGYRALLVSKAEDVQQLTPSAVSYAVFEGSNLVALNRAAVNPDPVSVFAGIENWTPDYNLQRWDACTQGLIAYDIGSPEVFGNMVCGDGWWMLNVPQDDVLQYSGADHAGNCDQWLSLPKAGWSIVGCPVDYSIRWADFLVTNGQETLTLTDARDRGWIYSTGYWWDGACQGSRDFGLPDDYSYTEWWMPWHGYWVHPNVDGLALIVPNVYEIIGRDTFSRSLTWEWGTADLGGAWTLLDMTTGGSWVSSGAVPYVNGNEGAAEPATGWSPGVCTLGPTVENADVTVRVNIGDVAGDIGPVVKASSYNTFLAATVSFYESEFRIEKYVNGVKTVLQTQTEVPVSYNGMMVRLRTYGNMIWAKCWSVGAEEPANWNLESDAGYTVPAGKVGVWAGSDWNMYVFDDFLARGVLRMY